MINEIEVKKYCKEDISKIKNYDKAIADTTQTWHCHHILGEILSKEQLEAHDFYYNVPACMLKFVTSSEHRRIHNKDNTFSLGLKRTAEVRKKMSDAHKGKTLSKETRRKMSEARKGRSVWNKGKKNIFSEDTLKKLSAAHKGRKTKGSTGMHWYNNGVINKYEYSCPDGFVEGRLK